MLKIQDSPIKIGYQDLHHFTKDFEMVLEINDEILVFNFFIVKLDVQELV